MMAMDKRNKRALKFLSGYSTTVFSLLGYLCVGTLSPNPYIWWIVIPVMLLILITDCKMLVDWLDKE